MHNTVERQRFQINSSRLLPFFFFGEIFCAKKKRKTEKCSSGLFNKTILDKWSSVFYHSSNKSGHA